MKYFVLKRPSVMEDEGRHALVFSSSTLEEAEDFRDKFVKESAGWYSKGSFLIAKEYDVPDTK